MTNQEKEDKEEELGEDAGRVRSNTGDTEWLQDEREEGGSYDVGLQGS